MSGTTERLERGQIFSATSSQKGHPEERFSNFEAIFYFPQIVTKRIKKQIWNKTDMS